MRIWIASLVSSLLLASCAGGDTEPAGGRYAPRVDDGDAGVDAGASADAAPARQIIANIAFRDIPANLIVNGDFEDYADPDVPAGWSVNEIYGYAGMFTPATGWRGGAVQFVRNSQGQHFLAQTVPVMPNHRYTAQMVYEVVASDASHGGLYLFDPTDGTLIGSDAINRPTNGWQIAAVTFDSGARTQVTLEIGYPSGMNGTAIYDAVSMFEADPALAYQYQTSYRDVIGIANAPVDDLVPQLADYVTTLLAGSREERLAHRDAYAAYLPYYLDQFLAAPNGTSGRASWCQHTSLALGELLAMYGVRTRQIHARVVQHQFLEYFDGQKWVVFDPYYGIRYVLAGARLGVDAVVAAGMTQVSIEVPTKQHVFFLELGYLLPIWASGVFVQGLDM